MVRCHSHHDEHVGLQKRTYLPNFTAKYFVGDHEHFLCIISTVTMDQIIYSEESNIT